MNEKKNNSINFSFTTLLVEWIMIMGIVLWVHCTRWCKEEKRVRRSYHCFGRPQFFVCTFSMNHYYLFYQNVVIHTFEKKYPLSTDISCKFFYSIHTEKGNIHIYSGDVKRKCCGMEKKSTVNFKWIDWMWFSPNDVENLMMILP